MQHMVEAARAIESYTSRGRTAFDADPAIREAIVFQIIIIGEAAKAAVRADEATSSAVAIEWSALARMRDKVTHQYWAIDTEIVWDTATREIPSIRRALEDALKGT